MYYFFPTRRFPLLYVSFSFLQVTSSLVDTISWVNPPPPKTATKKNTRREKEKVFAREVTCRSGGVWVSGVRWRHRRWCWMVRCVCGGGGCVSSGATRRRRDRVVGRAVTGAIVVMARAMVKRCCLPAEKRKLRIWCVEWNNGFWWVNLSRFVLIQGCTLIKLDTLQLHANREDLSPCLNGVRRRLRKRDKKFVAVFFFFFLHLWLMIFNPQKSYFEI